MRDGGTPEPVGATRRLATALAVLLLVALAGVTVRQVGDFVSSVGEPSGELEILTDQDEAQTEATVTHAPAASGQWALLPRAPIDAGADALAVWTGDQVFVWGGWTGTPDRRRPRSDAALYEPRQHTWARALSAPRPWQEGAVAVWTGEDVLVLGGRHGVGREPLAQAWRRADGDWRPLARPPFGDWAWSAAVWTGREVVVYDRPGHGGRPGERIGIAYDPTVDRWRRVPTMRQAHPGDVRGAAWLGDQVVLAIEDPDGGLVLQTANPRHIRATRSGRAAPFPGQWLAEVVEASSQDRVFLAGRLAGGDQDFAVATWFRQTGWVTHDTPPVELRGRGRVRLFETPHGLLLWPDGPGTGTLRIAGVWRPLPRPPMDKRAGEAVVWTPDGLFVWGGHDGDARTYGSGALFRPTGLAGVQPAPVDASLPLWPGQWSSMGLVNPRLRDGDLLSDGRTLSVLGRVAEGPRQVWREVAGNWGPLPQEAGDEHDTCAVTVAGEVLVWGRTGAGPDGLGWAGHRVGTDGRGGPVPLPPLPAFGTVLCTVWNGRAVVVTGSGEGWAAAAFDVRTRQWEGLPELRIAGLPIAALPLGDGPHAPLAVLTDLSLARLESGGVWRVSASPRNNLPPYSPVATWTGSELLVWGGRTEEALRGGWTWNPQRDRWRQLPPAPVGGPADAPPHAWSGARWIVWGETETETESGQGGFAVYDPSTEQWQRLPPPTSSGRPADVIWHDGALITLGLDGRVSRFVPNT